MRPYKKIREMVRPGLISHNGNLPDYVRQHLAQHAGWDTTESRLRHDLAERDEQIRALRQEIAELQAVLNRRMVIQP